ncbi:variable surface lipoprotein [Mycoplasmopsis agalactiae]|uniref:variable surface lipoprotein n=1 Tax=Mycoplasmopsis agalactiae TaxID=2110 RepID=UPI001F388134|nr:variable surface lipoprotein [Mycoplasmopsis agalactiae]MCE6115560.1 variable surface lipoprotein [Mycoplasmopsis agalactiae]
MKKSKFLLLGSISSLAAIPFVAAKCGGTKEEEKKPAEMPGGNQKDPKTPAEGSQNPGTEGSGNQQGSEINVKALKDKINSIWGLAPEFEDRLQNSFKEGDTYQSVLDKIASKLGDKEKELIKLVSESDKDKKLGLQAQQKIKIKVGTEELELEFGKVTSTSSRETNPGAAAKPKLSETLKSITGSDLGKVQVAEQDKNNKEKVEAAIKDAIVKKVPTLKDKELKLNAELSKKSVTVSAKDFEGEVTLKFDV